MVLGALRGILSPPLVQGSASSSSSSDSRDSTNKSLILARRRAVVFGSTSVVVASLLNLHNFNSSSPLFHSAIASAEEDVLEKEEGRIVHVFQVSLLSLHDFFFNFYFYPYSAGRLIYGADRFFLLYMQATTSNFTTFPTK